MGRAGHSPWRGSGSPGLSPQRTLEVSEQIQKPRALLLPLQLEVLQVFRLVLKVKVSFVLPLLLPLQIQVGRAAPLGMQGLRLLGSCADPPRLPWPAGAAAGHAPHRAAPGPALALGPSPTPREGDVGRGPGAPPRRKISVLTVRTSGSAGTL